MQDFPERIGYKMLDELCSKTIRTLNTKLINLSYSAAPPEGSDGVTNGDAINVISATNAKQSKDELQFCMVECHRNFCDINKVSKIHSMQTDVDLIHVDMKRNVKNMVRNIEQISVSFVFYV